MVFEMGTGVFGLDVRRMFGSTANTIGMRWDTGGVWADAGKNEIQARYKNEHQPNIPFPDDRRDGGFELCPGTCPLECMMAC